MKCQTGDANRSLAAENGTNGSSRNFGVVLLSARCELLTYASAVRCFRFALFFFFENQLTLHENPRNMVSYVTPLSHSPITPLDVSEHRETTKWGRRSFR